MKAIAVLPKVKRQQDGNKGLVELSVTFLQRTLLSVIQKVLNSICIVSGSTPEGSNC